VRILRGKRRKLDEEVEEEEEEAEEEEEEEEVSVFVLLSRLSFLLLRFLLRRFEDEERCGEREDPSGKTHNSTRVAIL